MDQDGICMEVGLGPGHIVLDGDPAPPPRKRGPSPQFSAQVYCGQTAALNQGAFWCHASRPRPRTHCYMGTQLPQQGLSPQFSAHVYCGQTVAHLSYC